MTLQHLPSVLAVFTDLVSSHSRGYPVGSEAIPTRPSDGVDHRPPYFIVDVIGQGGPFSPDGMSTLVETWQWTFQVRAVGERLDQARMMLSWIDQAILVDRAPLAQSSGWYEIDRFPGTGVAGLGDEGAGVVSVANRYAFAIGSR